MYYTIFVPIFVYSQVSFMRHYNNMPLFSIFYSLYLHKSYLLVSICCYQISGFTIRAPLTARINFGSIHYQQFVKLFDKLFVKPFAMVPYLVFFFTYYYSISFRFDNTVLSLTNCLTNNLTNCWQWIDCLRQMIYASAHARLVAMIDSFVISIFHQLAPRILGPL